MGSVTYVVVSYFPLLTGSPGESFDPSEEAMDVLGHLFEELPDGGADCVLWTMGDAGPSPVLVMENADAIYDHLVSWSEGDPTEWFTLTLMRRGGKYLIGLAPDIKRSVDRFKIARQLSTGLPVPHDAEFSVMFRCLYFVSGSSNTFDSVEDRVPAELRVGLMDKSLLNLEDPESMDPDRIRWLGPFPCTREGQMDEYFVSVIEGASESGRSVLFKDGKPSVP
jgi:hypothetical protein